MDGLITGMSLPSADRYVNEPWIDLDSKADTANTFCGDQSAAGTEKAIKDNVAASGAIEKGVSYKCNRLDGRMEGKEVALVALFGESVYARVFPNVAPVSAILSKLDVIAVSTLTVSEYKDQFVPGAI
jgi:hypothetical protein